MIDSGLGIRSGTLVRFSCSTANVNETRDVFVITDIKKRLNVGVIGIPFGEPLAGKSRQASGDQEILAYRACG